MDDEVKNPTASCGALREREPHIDYDEVAFIPPASWRVFSEVFYKTWWASPTLQDYMFKKRDVTG
jgi:hypothetical protein